jgi:hypothetical protein
MVIVVEALHAGTHHVEKPGQRCLPAAVSLNVRMRDPLLVLGRCSDMIGLLYISCVSDPLLVLGRWCSDIFELLYIRDPLLVLGQCSHEGASSQHSNQLAWISCLGNILG